MICPRCKSSNLICLGANQAVIPPKIKRQTSLNLNPLKPFTLTNTKEKVVSQGYVGIKTYRMHCNMCGYDFFQKDELELAARKRQESIICWLTLLCFIGFFVLLIISS